MDQNSLVDRQIDDGQRLVQRLVQDNFEVTAAFWLKRSEEDWWHLYVASKVVDERGPLEAYGAVQASLQQLPGTRISLTDVKVIGASNPITSAVLKVQKLYSGTAPIRFRGLFLGGTPVEDALIYAPAPRTEDSVPSKV